MPGRDARERGPLALMVPFYRGREHLRETLESALAQRCDAWRLLVLDDREPARPEAGEDPDGDIEALVASFRDPRLAYRRNPRRLGMAANWNRGLELADAELVTLVHADDRLLPDYVGGMRELARRHPEAVALSCGARILDAAGRPRFSLADAVKPFFVPRGGDPVVLRGERALRALLAGNFIMCPTLCFRRARLGPRRFHTGWKQVQDLELTTRLLLEGETLVHTRAAWYAYRRHAGGMTAIQSESLLRFDEECALFAQLAARAEARGWRRAAATARRRAIVRLHAFVHLLEACVRGRPARARRLWPYVAGSARPASPGGATR